MAETPEERRKRRRAEEAGLTEDQLLAREDEAFDRSKAMIQADDLADAYRRQAKSVPSFAKANQDKAAEVDRKAARARELAAEGWSARRIAGHFDVTTKTVSRWLRRPPA